MKKPSSVMYGITRKLGKIASTMNDVETVLTFNPKKIVKRFGRKKVSKVFNSKARKVNNKLFK